MKKNVSINDIVPLIVETVNNGGKFRLYPKGISMMPLIRENKDSVLLEKCESISKDDILLYRRKEGVYVLHRVISVCDSLTFCGDNQHVYERNVPKENVIAKVCAVYRKERIKKCDGFYMKLYLKYIKLRRKKRVLFRLAGKFLKRVFGK
ncbi:MAG: hypothetical protein J6A69_12840 [Clostridia bacterium]|nr:hypothetical protein [Clostridia bacterium]